MSCGTMSYFLINRNRPLHIEFDLVTITSSFVRDVRNSLTRIVRFTTNIETWLGVVFANLHSNWSFFIPFSITLLVLILKLWRTWCNSSFNRVLRIIRLYFLFFFKPLTSIFNFRFDGINFFFLFILLLLPHYFWNLLPFCIEANIAFGISTILFIW